MSTTTVNLVLAGGGVKGIALVGALFALEEADYRVSRVAGTSAGAVVGGLIAAGYTATELIEIMEKVPYRQFQDEGLLDKFGLPGRAASLLIEKGVYEGDFFCEWYEELLAQKGVSTFGELKQDGAYRLASFAADISRGQLVRFPDELPSLGLDPDRQLISLAVRASISIPFYYEPTKLAGNYLVDGGILSNFPIKAFEKDDIPTIGIKLSGHPEAIAKPHDITGPISYAAAVFNTMLSLQDQIHMNDQRVIEQTVFVDTGSVMATDFDISRPQQQQLFEAGYQATKKYLARQSKRV